MSKKRVAVYIRVNVELDIGKIKNAYKQRFAERDDCELVDIYWEQGCSGLDANRPMFKQVVEDAKAGKIDYIVCKSLAMFSRDSVVAIKTIRDLKEKGVGLYFEIEKMNTLDDATSATLSLMATMAEMEYRMKKKEQQFESEHPEWLRFGSERDEDEPDEFD